MRIGILGTRGIPNHYGGFERLAEQLSCGLVEMGHEVFVYNSHNHLYQENTWNGVNIVHCYDPEYLIGSSGQFVYDLNCVIDARRKKFDVILMLGYTSSSIWGPLFPKDAVIIYNMDGMEWKRSKYSKPIRKFLRYAERLAVKYGDHFVTDSLPVRSYFQNKYGLKSEYIAYGATVFENGNEKILKEYGVDKHTYHMLVARMEPENNIEMILDGFAISDSDKQFIVVGNTDNKFGKYLMEKFSGDQRIRFIGAVYEEEKVHVLRLFSHFYFHGHSTGGTNPSLLEAMASKAFIAAHNNVFNKSVLKDDALYFRSAADIKHIVENTDRYNLDQCMLCRNSARIEKEYDWHSIFVRYEQFMVNCSYSKINERSALHKRFSWK